MDELQPCPWCMRQGVKMQHNGLRDGRLRGLWAVGCPVALMDKYCGYECEVHPAARWYAKLSDAVKAWNTRKEDGDGGR